MMRRSLIRRMEKLEARCAEAHLARVPVAVLMDSVPDRPLAPGEHVAEDWYRESGGLYLARERITSDAADTGRRCQPGGFLLDVVAELHANCCWREIPGACPTCRGTPVAR
jgi:hypothetical protein